MTTYKSDAKPCGQPGTPAPAFAQADISGCGTALVLEEFGNVVARGGAGVVIASQSGHGSRRSPEQNKALATSPAAELLALPMLQPDQVADPLYAYQVSKRGNSLRVLADDFLMDGGVTAAYWYDDLAPT